MTHYRILKIAGQRVPISILHLTRKQSTLAIMEARGSQEVCETQLKHKEETKLKLSRDEGDAPRDEQRQQERACWG